MFSVVSVCHFVHRAGSTCKGPSCLLNRPLTPSAHSPVTPVQTVYSRHVKTYSRTVCKEAVGILLNCLLVIMYKFILEPTPRAVLALWHTAPAFVAVVWWFHLTDRADNWLWRWFLWWRRTLSDWIRFCVPCDLHLWRFYMLRHFHVLIASTYLWSFDPTLHFQKKNYPSIFTASKRSLGQGNVFTGVCLSTGESASRGSASGGSALGGSALRRSASSGVRKTASPSDIMGYDQRAGGTHPTEMQSLCFNLQV